MTSLFWSSARYSDVAMLAWAFTWLHWSRTQAQKNLVLGMLILTACGDASARAVTLTGPAAVNATAIAARQTANAANAMAEESGAFANSIEAQQTAVRQTTLDALSIEQARAALEKAQAEQTATATRVFATEETARQQATGTATREQGLAMQRVAETALARQKEYAITAQAQVDETATATRVYATEVAQLVIDEQNAQDAALRRETERQIASARTKTELEFAPMQRAVEMFLPSLGCLAVLVVGLIGLFGLFRALEGFIRAKSLDVAAPALAQMQIRDVNGNPMGYLQLQRNGVATFQPYFVRTTNGADELTGPPRAAVPLTDMQDRKALEAPKSDAISEITERGIVTIHYSDLLVFTRMILDKNDWSQPTWADTRLPRGYVLTKDEGKNGQRTYGGYSRLLQLFVDKHLIVNRRQGKSGDWNPHAPRDADTVIKILTGEIAPPRLPDELTPSPTLLRADSDAI